MQTRLFGRADVRLVFAPGATSGPTPAPLSFEVASVKPAVPIDFSAATAGKMRIGMTIDAARAEFRYLSQADWSEWHTGSNRIRSRDPIGSKRSGTTSWPSFPK